MSVPVVLVVDDHPANLKLVRVTLRRSGLEVLCAADAEETLGRLGEGLRPDLILMDLQLPGMDGLELTRRLKADPATAGITIVAVTAYAMKGDAERAIQAGCDGYLPKPIDVEALPGLVHAWLARAREPGP